MLEKNAKIVLIDNIPEFDELQELTIYISFKYDIAIHKCACGCGREVMTPLGKDGWTVKYDGEFSFSPSIGNYYFPCKSHYYVKNNKFLIITDDYKTKKNKKNFFSWLQKNKKARK